MSTSLANSPSDAQAAAVRATGATIGSTWLTVAGRQFDDELLDWPPDVFAFTEVILERTEAYRFAVSPPAGRAWPPTSKPRWRQDVNIAARRWSCQTDEQLQDLPQPILEQWRVVRDALDTPMDEIASGQAWRICEALLTLHAVADEACAGVAGGIPRPGHGIVSGARMRELLARTGTLARIDPAFVRVLPKYRTPSGGIRSRSISRYLSLVGPAVNYNVTKVRTRRHNPEPDPLNLMLLPWPLRVSPEGFRPLSDSINERDVEPFGFFRFRSTERLDVSLVDNLLRAANERVGQVDIVVLPESSVLPEDLAGLEAVLSRNGVTMLIAGLSDGPSAASQLGSNWVHFGAALDGQWFHYRQDKHHRWSLDRSQIEQYHLDEVLDPRVRWWEAMEINRRSLQVIERDDGPTIAALVCEDLAQIDDVVDLLRAVGPTILIGLLLDGPQLGSRWTARYASMLADDPGSAVLTLTSYGMVANAWRADQPPSSVVALWKDNDRGLHEIELEPDAQAILLRLNRQTAIRRAADGRLPEHDSSDLRISDIIQLRAAPTTPPALTAELASPTAPTTAEPASPPTLSGADQTVLLAWSDAVAQALARNPGAIDTIVDSARTGASWRTDLRVPQPAGALANALNALAPTMPSADQSERLTPAHAISRAAAEALALIAARTQVSAGEAAG